MSSLSAFAQFLKDNKGSGKKIKQLASQYREKGFAKGPSKPRAPRSACARKKDAACAPPCRWIVGPKRSLCTIRAAAAPRVSKPRDIAAQVAKAKATRAARKALPVQVAGYQFGGATAFAEYVKKNKGPGKTLKTLAAQYREKGMAKGPSKPRSACAGKKDAACAAPCRWIVGPKRSLCTIRAAAAPRVAKPRDYAAQAAKAKATRAARKGLPVQVAGYQFGGQCGAF